MDDRLRSRVDAGREVGGFTLIEFLIVIVVLGILSAIVVFAVSGTAGRGDSAACRSEHVEVAQEAACAQAGR